MSATRGKTRTEAQASMTNAEIAEAIRTGTTKEALAERLDTTVHGVRRRLELGGYNHKGEVIIFAPEPTAARDFGDRDYSWQEKAACLNRDPALWDVESNADHYEGQLICEEKCEVRDRCLAAALEEEKGQRLTAVIRGGLWPEERRAVLAGKTVRRRDPRKCKNGHTRTAENTTTGARGGPRCRDCDREQTAARRNRNAA